jgi:hypothetical protein
MSLHKLIFHEKQKYQSTNNTKIGIKVKTLTEKKWPLYEAHK